MFCYTYIPTYWRKLLPAYSALKLEAAEQLLILTVIHDMQRFIVFIEQHAYQQY